MTTEELFNQVKKTWTGKELLKIRELDYKLNIFQLKEILLDAKTTFLTKDEILYFTFLIKEEQIKNNVNLTYFCTKCEDIQDEYAEFKIKDLPVQERKVNQSIELNGVMITSVEPNRSITLDEGRSEPQYNLDEMLTQLKFEDVTQSATFNSKDFVLNLGVQDFLILETFYNETKFKFYPVVSLKCSKCGKVTKINIDSLPMDGLE